eukprot:11954305-Ditylum_brightwellii.AAC.1
MLDGNIASCLKGKAVHSFNTAPTPAFSNPPKKPQLTNVAARYCCCYRCHYSCRYHRRFHRRFTSSAVSTNVAATTTTTTFIDCTATTTITAVMVGRKWW